MDIRIRFHRVPSPPLFFKLSVRLLFTTALMTPLHTEYKALVGQWFTLNWLVPKNTIMDWQTAIEQILFSLPSLRVDQYRLPAKSIALYPGWLYMPRFEFRSSNYAAILDSFAPIRSARFYDLLGE